MAYSHMSSESGRIVQSALWFSFLSSSPKYNQRLHCTCLEQRCKVQPTKRVHNIMVFANGNLDEAETSRVMVHGIRFGIDGGHVVLLQIGKQTCQRFFAIYQYVFLVFHHLEKKCN